MQQGFCYGADVIDLEGGDALVDLAVMGGGETEEKIDGGESCDRAGALLLQHQSREHGGADIFENIGGNAMLGDLANLMLQQRNKVSKK